LAAWKEFYPGFPGSARFQRAHGFGTNRARKMRALPGMTSASLRNEESRVTPRIGRSIRQSSILKGDYA